MTERKVLNKYYPPDFDPDKLWSRRRFLFEKDGPRKGARQMNVRMMYPFSLCCANCGEFVYIGTKFNSRVERIRGEEYLGMPIWRFYGRCPFCRAEIVFKTDPKTTDYVLESGGTRTYEPQKDADLAESELKGKLASEIEGDAMKALEHKTYSTASELLAIEQLEELRNLNKRLLKPSEATAAILDMMAEQADEAADHLNDEEEEELSEFLETVERAKKHSAAGAEDSDDDERPQPASITEAGLKKQEDAGDGDECSRKGPPGLLQGIAGILQVKKPGLPAATSSLLGGAYDSDD